MQEYNLRYWFEDIPVLGRLPPSKIATKYRELGDTEMAQTIENSIKKEDRSVKEQKTDWEP